MNTQRGSRARVSAALGAVVTTVLALGLTLAPAASAADVGISGTVRNGTTGEVVGGLPVTVTFFDASSKLGIDKQTTAADGTFTSVPPASAAGYQVTATFRGTEYRTQATQLISGQPSVATLDVFEPTNDPKDVATTQAVLWVDRESGAFAVQEDYGWKNTGKTAYVGGAKGGGVVSLPLPDGATNLQFLGTFLEQRGAVKDGTYVSDAPIVPGKSTATIRFTIPSLSTISLPVTFPTTGIQLFVPEGITVSATGVRLAGTIQDTGADGQPVTYQQYVIDGPPVGTTLDVAFADTGAADAGRIDWTTILLVVAGLAAVAALAFAIVGRRRAQQRTPVKGSRAPKARSAAGPSKAATTTVASAKTRTSNGHRSAPPKRTASVTMPAQEEDDIQLLVDEIAALDLSFENGVLDERTYRRLRVAAKDRLLLAQEASARGVPR